MKKLFNHMSFRTSATLSLSKCAARYGICLILFSMLFISCDKNDDNSPQDPDPVSQLPPITMTGENTFGFLLNGEPINITSTTNQVAIYQSGLLQIAGEIDSSSNDFGVSIRLQNPLQVNIPYDLTNFPVHRARYNKRFNDMNCDYNFEDTYQGSIVLTNIDENNFIVSGILTFQLLIKIVVI